MSKAGSSFVERCREAGLAVTAQRRIIYQELAASGDHPTAEALYLRVKKHLPRVSLATVYRNLRCFARAGLVDEVATGCSFARYDANRDRHHHLVCDACGGVTDYYSADFDLLGMHGEVIDGFEVHDLKVHVLGLCRSCRSGVAQRGARTTRPLGSASSDAAGAEDRQEETKPWQS